MDARDRLLPTLSRFTRTILAPFDINTVLEDLAEAANHVLALAGSGVSLISEGRLTYATCIPSDLVAIEQAQEQLQAGPCVDAVRLRTVVAVPDVGVYQQEWSSYCAAASDAGVVSVAGIPMQLGDTVIGALNLYSTETRAWSDEDLAIAQVLADMATGYLIQASELSKQQQLSQHLQTALDSRVIIEQAKGVVAATHNISIEAAFALIRGHARSHNTSLRRVAQEVLHDGLQITPGQAPSPRDRGNQGRSPTRK